jgi:hypothetical protein
MDGRPQLERSLTRARLACLLLVAGCALLGGVTSGALVWLTTRTH